VLSSTISATSKLPSGSGLAMSKIPGWVVPGPFGSLALVAVVVRVVVGEVLGDGEADGAWAVGTGTVSDGGPPASAGADRGSCGASR
jgi:hypothetical protein